MTRAEFHAWLKERQQRAHQPKLAPQPTREPGDESDFAPVANLADRLQDSLNQRRENQRERTR